MRGVVPGALASLLLAGCGSDPPVVAASPAPSSTPVPAHVDIGQPYSRRDSCVKIDEVFELANGKGAFSPLYGFANLDPEIDVRLLSLRKQVLEAYRAAGPRIDAGVAPHGKAFAGFLQMLVDMGEQQTKAEATTSSGPLASSGAPEASARVGDEPDLDIARKAALEDARRFGQRFIGRSDADAMNRFARDYAAFYDACASDLGITKKDQRAFHAVVLDPATGAATSP